MVLRIILFGLFFSSFTLSACGQDERVFYDVLHDGDTVGFVQASKRERGEETQYEVVSDITLSMLLQVRVNYTVNAVFLEGILQYASATIYVNGKEKNHVEAERKQGDYEVKVDGDLHRIEGPIAASSASLYFVKPDGLSAVFSETSGTLKSINRESALIFNTVEEDQKSNRNRYTYRNGQVLERILVERFLMPTLLIVKRGQ